MPRANRYRLAGHVWHRIERCHRQQLLLKLTRTRRPGAFWDECSHATAVDTAEHLARCVTSIALNMVRADVVGPPRLWSHCGDHEGQPPPAR